MIISTTNSLENAKITNYLGIVSGTDIYLVGGLLGGGLANQELLYTRALNNAINNMTAKAVAKRADAIVGFSTNIVSPGNLNNIIVIATGTAVKVQWNRADTPSTPKPSKTGCIVSAEEQNAREIEEKVEKIEDENLVPDPSKEDPEKPLPCPHCDVDLAFMGWTENDLKTPQVCPVCGKEILLEK